MTFEPVHDLHLTETVTIANGALTNTVGAISVREIKLLSTLGFATFTYSSKLTS